MADDEDTTQTPSTCTDVVDKFKQYTKLSDFEWLDQIVEQQQKSGNAHTSCAPGTLENLSSEQLLYLCGLEHSVRAMLRYKRPSSKTYLLALENLRDVTLKACTQIENRVTDKRQDTAMKSYWTFKNIIIFVGVVVCTSLILASVVFMIKALSRNRNGKGDINGNPVAAGEKTDLPIEVAEKAGSASARSAESAASSGRILSRTVPAEEVSALAAAVLFP